MRTILAQARGALANPWHGLMPGLGLVALVTIASWRFVMAPATRRIAGAAAVTAPARAGQHRAGKGRPLSDKRASIELDLPAGTAEAEEARTPFLRALEAALKAIGTESDPTEKEMKLDALAEGMAIADLPQALDFLQEREASDSRRALGVRLIRRWAGRDPAGVAARVGQMPDGPTRREAIPAVAGVWANIDLPGTVNWLRRLPDGEAKVSGLLAAAYEAARSMPVEALTLAADLPSGPDRDALVVHAASQWAAAAPSEAAEWTGKISDPALRGRVMAVVLPALGEKDPAGAATWALQSMAPGKEQDDAVVGIVQRWVQNEPEPAAVWVAQFPEGDLRQAALENVVKLWADQDVDGAGRWLDGLSRGEGRDAAIGAYLGKITPSHPRVAAVWAEGIDADGLRVEQIERVGKAWLEVDTAGARAWIAGSELSAEAKARLLAPGGLNSGPGAGP